MLSSQVMLCPSRPFQQSCKPNRNSALVNVQFVDQAIDELFADGQVREVDLLSALGV